MSRRLVVLALVLLLLPVASAWHQGHRHWSTIPDGPYSYAPPQPQTFLASDGTEISYAVFMPNVPPGTRVPVIVSAGPYFGLLEEPVNVPSTGRLTGFLIDNFVSHGYAVVPVSIRGTGLSGGCIELMSLREAKDLDELVTFLANEPWSNGNIAMTGKSYDGGTPWMVAQFGNPHLKTIVPIAGVTDQGDLLYHRGGTQFRGPVFHSVVYWPFGFGFSQSGLSPDPWYRPLDKRLENAICPELVKGQALGVYSAYTGDTQNVPVVTDYWGERAFRERTLQNYNGSVFIVHGLQDWNVIPSQVAPFFNDLQVPKKMMLGQWAHHYADEGQATNRNDFAQILKNWFDRELKGMNVSTGPTVEVADAFGGTWRTYSEWPPTPASVHTWHLSANKQLTQGAPSSFSVPFASPAGTTAHARPCMNGAGGPTYFSAVTTQPFRLSGVGSLTVLLDPPTPGTLTVSVCANNALIAHGGANTLYPDSNQLEPWAVGGPTAVRVDLEPAERTVPAGTRLSVAIRFEGGAEAGMSYWPATSPGVGVLVGGTLELPSAT
ncbi:MAG TPA: CocE/NonD family hydrolase [Candidatus Thermoplasmatota archaeon]|nr:CocE/NonD family hydrolase [Candidatus Thermoplasmatota archaeon]